MKKDKTAGASSLRKDHPDPVDVFVGKKLRQRRALVGMSQEKLATAVGVSFQQVQKYERGINRMGASRLHQFAQVLNIPVSFFFENLEVEQPANSEGEDERLGSHETLSLMRAFYAISEKEQRLKVISLVKSMAGE
ncbi:MAG: helix-turn-helix transcriptional regulator [Alphaproteobacteria bacterium]|nr:helix-turn-helix transcriptional regulator [Alphaproteobacteria bacterium]